MNVMSMTDEKLISQIKNYKNLCIGCDNCISYEAISNIIEQSLDLINRQREELCKLNNVIALCSQSIDSLMDDIKNCKIDSYKKFAYELKSGVPQETGIIRCNDVDFTLEQLTELAKGVKRIDNEKYENELRRSNNNEIT